MTKPPWWQSPGADYIDAVLSGRKPVCESIRKAVERAADDHENAHQRGLLYVPELAQRVIKYGTLCRHIKGRWAGKPFEHADWQLFCTGEIFGWVREDTRKRRYRIALVEIPKKNGKSSWFSVLGLYCLQADREPGAEVYVLASDKKQARIIFKTARAMAARSERINHQMILYADNLYIPGSESIMEMLPSDPDTIDGLNASCQLIDELHRHKTRELWDLAINAADARDQPLALCITTAGSDLLSVCYEQHEYGMSLLNKVFENDRYFAYIVTPDKEYDCWDEGEWAKLNPSLGITKTIEDMRDKALLAKETPKSQISFRRFQLNEWTQSVESWMPMDAWHACDTVVDIDELRGMTCYGGLDLALVKDMSCFVLVFNLDHAWAIFPYYYCPEDSVIDRTRNDGLPYQTWVERELLKATPGNVTDFNLIYDDIIALSELFEIVEIGFDPYRASQLANQLMNYGLNMVEVRQTSLVMDEPMQNLMAKVLSGQLVHNKHEILTWNAYNVVVRESQNKLIAPDRIKSREKIDGVVAGINGIARLISNEDIYQSGDAGRPFCVSI